MIKVKWTYNTYLILLIFLTTLNYGLTQSSNLTIKYIEIYSLPTNLHTYLHLDSDDVKSGKYPNSNHIIIKDSVQLLKFSELNFFKTKTEYFNNSEMDVRVIIEAHYTTGLQTIELDRRFNFKLDNKKYICNTQLKNWLESNKVFCTQLEKNN